MQAELVNGRFAMLAVAGILVPELLKSVGGGGPAAQVRSCPRLRPPQLRTGPAFLAPLTCSRCLLPAQVAWFDAGKYEYFAPPSTLFAVMIPLFAWVEIRRYQVRWVRGWGCGEA